MAVDALRFRGLWEDEMFARQASEAGFAIAFFCARISCSATHPRENGVFSHDIYSADGKFLFKVVSPWNWSPWGNPNPNRPSPSSAIVPTNQVA